METCSVHEKLSRFIRHLSNGLIYSIQICEISHQTFGPSNRKWPTCPMIFVNTGQWTCTYSRPMIVHMGRVTELKLSCYPVLLSVDSETRYSNKTAAPPRPDPYVVRSNSILVQCSCIKEKDYNRNTKNGLFNHL